MFLVHYIFWLSTLLLLQNQAYAAAIACNAVTEVSQTFNFSTTNTWPSGSTTRNYTIGTAPNDVTLTFTNTQVVTPMTGDPTQRTHGNIADTVTVSSNGGYAANTLLSTFALSTSRAINKLSFTITDEDANTSSGNNFRDRTISTTNAGVTTAITADVGANQTIVVGSGQATATNSADCDDTDNNCNIYLEFNRTGITTASTEFRAAHTGTSTTQRIGFNQYAWCLPRMPTVKVQKITTGHTGAGGTFTFADTNLTGTIASISTTAPSTATPASPTALPATTIDTDVTITETPASGFTLSTATCTDANSGSTGNPTSFGSLAGNVLTIPATNMRAGADITCTFTNRKTAQLTLRKTWTNAKVNDAVTVTTAGGTVNPSFASVANTANETDTGTATAVFAGETLTFTEPFSVGSAANYNASLSCTGATDTNLANGLTINAADSNIVCTYTNSRRTANLTARKTWTNGKINDAVNITTTGGINNVNFNATANTVSETDTATAITVYAGDALTFAESFTTGTATNYNRTLACTGNATALAGSVLTVNSADTNITCTYTNSRIAQSMRVDKQWTSSVIGHTASVTTTGGTNNPTFSSTAPINTTGTAVTVYAGDVVTLPAETFGGGGTAIGYNTTVACTGGSTLASGATGRTLTITNSATATICTYNNTKLPTITITKISNGGVRAFDFTGTNGFANQTITTVSSGVGVAGATQRLTAAGVSTTITETVPYGYALTNVACTGLGIGTATVNYATATVTLDTNATAAANNIACTFTNTAYGTTSFDTLLKTTRFSAVPDLPTIIRGFSGTQNIVITNHGPDDATGVVAYYRPLVATGVTVTAVSAPSGACTFSSPDWVCPPVASVLNGGSFNVTVTYSTNNTASLGTAQQGEIRINSNEYTECGGVNEYKYNVWGLGGNSQPQPAPTNSAFWVGNTNTTTTATPSGAYSTESSDIFQAWPTTQNSPTGSYLYSPVAGQANNIYTPSSTNATPTVSKVLTGLNGQPENNVLLPQFGSTGTFTGDNKRAWEGQTCVYVPVATTITPCLTLFDDAAYISVQNISTGITTVAAGQSNYNPGTVLSGNVSAAPGYYIIKARISNRNTNGGNSEDAQGGYGQLAGIGSATCSTAALDSLAQNAVPESINIIAPSTLNLRKISNTGTGTFGFALTNTVQTTGSVTTATAGVAEQVDGDTGTAGTQTFTIPANGVDITINENSLPAGWVLSSATCTNAGGTTVGSLVGSTYTIPAASVTAAQTFTCTFTNTRIAQSLTLAKQWTNAVNGHTATATTTGGTNNATINSTSTGNNLTTGTAVTVYAGDVVTLPAETFGGGASAADYNSTLACTGGSTLANGVVGRTLTISNSATATTCTYSNTRRTATFRLAKVWGANSISGNVANIGATTGLSNNTSAFTSTASTNTTGTSVTVFVGETVTLPAETMSTGTLSNYNTVLSCTADAGATANSLSGTNGQSSNTLTVGAGDEGKVITCTYTNTRIAQSFTLAKQWVNSKAGHTASANATGGTNLASFSSQAPSTNTVGTTVTMYAGDVVTLPAETFGGGASAADYNSTLACTGGSTLASGAVGRTVIISNSTTATTCTYTNTRKSVSLTVNKTWTNAKVNDAVSITTTGGTNNVNFSSTANTANETDSASAITVYAGDVLTFAESFTTGSAANYNSSLACTGAADTNPADGLTIGGSDTAISCTYTNSLKSVTITANKTWTNAKLNDAVSITTTGGTNNVNFSSTANTANETDSASVVTVYAGDVLTFAESFTTGSAANYNSSLACTGAADTNPADGLTIGGSDTAISCTYTNSRKASSFRLAKAWGAFSMSGNVANIAATTGLTNNTTAFTSTASTATNSNTVTVYAGDVATLPAETMSTGTLTNYNTVLSCTTGAGATANTVSGTNGQSSNTLSIGAGDEGKLITCTYTNTRIAQSFTLAKQWVNSKAGHTATANATGGTNLASFSSQAPSTNTVGTTVTMYAGDVITLPAETFGGGASAADYNSTLACTGGSTLANGAVGRTVTISNSTTATTCTYSNTRRTATFRLAKVWGANSISGNVANIGATTGLGNNTSAFTSTASTNTTGTSVTVFVGETVTLPAETMSTGTLSNYNTVLSCTADAGATANSLSGTNGQSSNTLTVGAGDEGKVITCTYTNTRISQSLTLAKQWANAVSGHTATVTTTGGTNNATVNSTSTGNNLTTGTAVTVYAGDVVTLPAETFGGGASAANYNSTLACTGGSTLASGAVGRSVTISNSGTATTCTYTNTSLADMVPSFIYMPNTAIVGSAYYGKFSCTNNGSAPASTGASCAISLPTGLTASCTPTVPTASTVAVGASINCTVTGTPTTATTTNFVLTTGATNDNNGGTTTGGNNQITQVVTIVDSTVAPTCSPGSTTNLVSAVGTELYFADNTVTPITNNFGLIANLASYVRTGANFVVKGDWRWRNANPAAGSPAMTYQLLVNGTVYAQLVGTPSGQEVGTLTALNGATLDGGLTTMQLYDFSVSGLAALPVGVTLPSTVTSISTLSMSFVSSTTPADDAGLAPTILNACALPKLTLTKVSHGGTGSFSFTGNNGFSNQTITTTAVGTDFVGATQSLTAVSTTTTISETIPTGYMVTDISCTGLGSGIATPNLATGTVTISDTALVYGANLACTFTNTAFNGYIISGKVFYDNGKNAATPHNGIQEVDEQGIGNALVRLTDCASTVYQTITTNGAGNYSLTIPSSLTAGTTLCVEEYQQPANLVSVSGSAGTTGGSYTLATDKVQFTLAAATNYTGVDFGDVAQSQLTGTGNQTIAAGTTVAYGHQFIAGTEGVVTFNTAQTPTPLLSWTSLVYLDNNCNAVLDGGDTQVTTSISVVADQVLCLLQKVQSPSTANNGSQNISTLGASFVYAAPSAIIGNYNQADTTIIMDSGLVLVKKVRQVSSCPSTGADSNPFTTNNQALPNALIEYQIAYSNPSSHTITNIAIYDMTPSFTTFRSASCHSTPSGLSCATPSLGSGTAPSIGGVGSISWIMSNTPSGLNAGASGEVRFCVRVDQ